MLPGKKIARNIQYIWETEIVRVSREQNYRTAYPKKNKKRNNCHLGVSCLILSSLSSKLFIDNLGQIIVFGESTGYSKKWFRMIGKPIISRGSTFN